MKFASRFTLAAIAVAVAFTTFSCTSQSPSAPVGVNPTIEPGIGGSAGRPAPMRDPEDPISLACRVSLTGSPDGVLSNSIPFSLSCENMGAATMTIVQTGYNKRGCLTSVLGLLTFGDTGHQFSFSMQINRDPLCELDGGSLKICSSLFAVCKVINLPVLTRFHTGLSQPAN